MSQKGISKIYDLTVEIAIDMPVYPGQSKPTITQTETIERGGYNLSSFVMGTHVGIHVHAPKALVADGMSIDAVPPSCFMGLAVGIDTLGVDRYGSSTCSPQGFVDQWHYHHRVFEQHCQKPGRKTLSTGMSSIEIGVC